MVCECGKGIFSSHHINFLDNKNLASGAEPHPHSLSDAGVHGCTAFPYKVKPYEKHPPNNVKKYGCQSTTLYPIENVLLPSE